MSCIRFKTVSFVAICCLLTSVVARAQVDPQTARDLYQRITPSLVVVQYTYDGEMGRAELNGAGVVVSDSGLIMFAEALTPSQIPDEQMKDFKIIIPGDDETEIPAEFEGRDDRTQMSFIRPKDKAAFKWVPVKFADEPIQVGDPIVSIGLLPKDGGYKSFLTTATVSALLRGPVPQVLVTAGSVGGVACPVLNVKGEAIGIVHAQRGTSIRLNEDARSSMDSVLAPPMLFVPSRDFLISLSDPPVAGTRLKIPHIGVAQLSGVNRELADYLGIKGQPAVQVGDVIPNFPAAKAGLKSGDVIVKVNGQPLERGDEPEEAPMIMTRKIMRMKVGQTVTFSVLGGKDQPLKDVAVTLEERPPQAGTAKRFFAEDLGFGSRGLVFEDTYVRKLPPDTKGVMVALIKPNSSAQTGKLQTGDLITRLNQTPVSSLDQFKEQYQSFRKDHPRDAVVMEVLRGVNTQIVRIEPPQ